MDSDGTLGSCLLRRLCSLWCILATHTLHLFPGWSRGAQRARVTQCPQEFQQLPICQVVQCMSGSRKGREEEDRGTRAEGDHTVGRAFQVEMSPIAPHSWRSRASSLAPWMPDMETESQRGAAMDGRTAFYSLSQHICTLPALACSSSWTP